jgi:hypothetical protein
MIEIEVSKTSAVYVGGRETLTSGRVGLMVKVGFTSDWRDLMKTAVVYGSGETLEMAVGQDNTFPVPHECMTEVGSPLKLGICGMTADGTVVIPTVYCDLGMIQEGAVPTGETGADPTPSAFNQLMAVAYEAIEKAENAAQTAEESAAQAGKSVADGRYISWDIGEDGRLYCTRTDNADNISAELDENGRMVLIIE